MREHRCRVASYFIIIYTTCAHVQYYVFAESGFKCIIGGKATPPRYNPLAYHTISTSCLINMITPSLQFSSLSAISNSTRSRSTSSSLELKCVQQQQLLSDDFVTD